MKVKLKKDSIVKKFITAIIISLCLFGLSAGAITAMGNTNKQLRNSRNDVVGEKEVVEFLREVKDEFKSIKIVY